MQEEHEGRAPILPRQGTADEAGLAVPRNEGDDVEGHALAQRSDESPGAKEDPGSRAQRRPDWGDDVEGHVMTPPDHRSGESTPEEDEGGEGSR